MKPNSDNRNSTNNYYSIKLELLTYTGEAFNVWCLDDYFISFSFPKGQRPVLECQIWT